MDAEPSKETGKAQAAVPHWFDANDVSHWYNPVTEFGKDALQLWNEQVTAQSERFQSIQNPIDFIDWFSYGLFSANQSRGNTMLEDPSLYNISNWLTSGIPDAAKGALFPDKPFSPEHWLNSFEMASLLMGGLKLAQSRAAMFDPKGTIDGAGRGSGGVGIGEKQSAKHAVGNAKQAQSVLDGIDPKYFNQQSRFGGGFYVGADGNTIVAELAEHGNTAKYAISYDLDLSGQKVLDLTNPQIASSWNYVPKLTSTNACQAIGETARVQGYSVVIFQSYRGEGYNYVIFNSFDKILSPRMIVPID